MNEQNQKSMKKQFITSVVCFALLVLMFLGSSIAWFTDTTANVNTMVAGKISIVQTQNGESGFPEVVLMPTMKVDNVVVVENDGNQPCYVRTIFAFEDKQYTDEDGNETTVLEKIELSKPDGVEIVIPGADGNGTKIQFTVNEGSKVTTYTVGYYQHTVALPWEDDQDSYTCLNSIALSADADNAWRDAVGDYYKVFVLSQAVQVTGLGDAADVALNQVFGGIDAANAAKWFAYILGGNVTEGDTAVTIPTATP